MKAAPSDRDPIASAERVAYSLNHHSTCTRPASVEPSREVKVMVLTTVRVS